MVPWSSRMMLSQCNIILLDQGRIIEQGTHQELLSQKGRYHQLYMLQYSKEQLKNA